LENNASSSSDENLKKISITNKKAAERITETQNAKDLDARKDLMPDSDKKDTPRV